MSPGGHLGGDWRSSSRHCRAAVTPIAKTRNEQRSPTTQGEPMQLNSRLALPLSALVLTLSAPLSSAFAACTATGFSRDSINLTAALINPTGTVSGDVNATGCNIGIYYGPGAHGRVDGANIHDANYFGVVNNGGDVDIRNSNISDIGEKPLNGTQHGVGIYFVFGAASKGSIQNN